MILLIEQFLIIYIILFCILMIYFVVRKRIKKLKDIPPTGMMYLINVYKIDLLHIGINNVERDLSLINSFIIVTDLFIYFKMNQLLLKLLIIFFVTLILIFIGYGILGKIYRRR